MNLTEMPHPTSPVDEMASSQNRTAPVNSEDSPAPCSSDVQQLLRGDTEEFQRLFDAYWQLYPVKSEIGRRLLRQLVTQLQLMEFGSRAELEAITLGSAAMRLLHQGTEGALNSSGVLATVNNPAMTAVGQFQGKNRKHYLMLVSQIEKTLQRESSITPPFDIQEFFPNEEACLQHLRTRLEHAAWQCPKCAAACGDWLPSRGRWECRGCHFQMGVRHGTVMFGSKLPLVKWFHLIDLICHAGPLTAAEIGRRVGINRESTVLKLRATVLSVLSHPNSDRLLAGIPSYRLQTSHLSQVIPLVPARQ